MERKKKEKDRTSGAVVWVGNLPCGFAFDLIFWADVMEGGVLQIFS